MKYELIYVLDKIIAYNKSKQGQHSHNHDVDICLTVLTKSPVGALDVGEDLGAIGPSVVSGFLLVLWGL